ncbi:MAG: hypothetical protein ACU85U_21310 [Gammaproteobacteria bacterium]|jgi:hypothetical protein
MTRFDISPIRHSLKMMSVAVAALLFSYSWPARLWAEDANVGNHHDLHSFRWKLRGSAWFALVAGDFETRNRLDNKLKVDARDDLEFTEPYITGQFEGAFRHERHDFSVVATIFDEREQGLFDRDFEFADVIFPVSVPFETELEITDISFRYAYALRDVENDGYRVGPHVGISNRN